MMARLRTYTSKMGFSILIPDGWEYNENLEKIDLAEKERERQGKQHPDDPPLAQNAKMFLHTLEGATTTMQMVVGTGRKAFYETLLRECQKKGRLASFDPDCRSQMRFLQQAVDFAATMNIPNPACLSMLGRLLILQKMTDEQRLQRKKELGFQEGFFVLHSPDNPDRPNIVITKFSMRSHKSASELYITYKQSLPAVFWSGIPDKIESIKNKAADNGEIELVENYVVPKEPESIDAYAVRGTTGWVINCFTTTFSVSKYKKLFSKIIDSFSIEIP